MPAKAGIQLSSWSWGWKVYSPGGLNALALFASVCTWM